jgi:hypothetical protein
MEFFSVQATLLFPTILHGRASMDATLPTVTSLVYSAAPVGRTLPRAEHHICWRPTAKKSMAMYKYSAFSQAHSIRVIELLPSRKKSESLSIRLKEVPLDDLSVFEALS